MLLVLYTCSDCTQSRTSSPHPALLQWLTTWHACMSGADGDCWPVYSCKTSLSSLPTRNCGTSWPPAGPDETTSGTSLKTEREQTLSITWETDEGVTNKWNEHKDRSTREENGALSEWMEIKLGKRRKFNQSKAATSRGKLGSLCVCLQNVEDSGVQIKALCRSHIFISSLIHSLIPFNGARPIPCQSLWLMTVIPLFV